MQELNASLSKKIVTVSPDYKDHRGGIGAVVSIYADFFEVFNFVPTYKYHDSNFQKILYYIKQAGVFVKTLIVNKEIKIVHIHGSHKGSFYRKFFIFLIAKKIFRKKIIYHVHSDSFDAYYRDSFKLQRKLVAYFVNGSDVLICLSPFWLTFFKETFRSKRTTIVNNVIHDPVKKASVLMGNDNIPVVHFLFMGRIGNRKGIFDIISVLSANKDFFLGKMKLFIGGDGEAEKLKEAIKHNGLSDFVEYVGWAAGDKKNQLFLNAHVYILPSYSEGLPISILEAMSYGLPVISTPVGGTPEIVKSDSNGILVQPGDLQGIKSAMAFFINNPQQIREFGKASLNGVAPYFPAFVSGQLQEVYETLSGEGRVST